MVVGVGRAMPAPPQFSLRRRPVNCTNKKLNIPKMYPEIGEGYPEIPENTYLCGGQVCLFDMLASNSLIPKDVCDDGHSYILGVILVQLVHSAVTVQPSLKRSGQVQFSLLTLHQTFNVIVCTWLVLV